MILSSIGLNKFNNVGFGKKHKKNNHIDSRQKLIENYEKLILNNLDSDCFCKNSKNCDICLKRQAEFRQEKGFDVLSIEELEFMDKNPELTSLVDFDFSAVVDELIANKFVSTGAHAFGYRYDKDNNLQVLVSFINGDGDWVESMYSKEKFINMMNNIRNLKIHLGIGNSNNINKSFDMLKRYLSEC